MEPQIRPLVVKVFDGTTQADSAEQFAADAAVAARLGYTPTSQTWDGTKLTVGYERQASTAEQPPHPAPEERAAANAQANRERAVANAKANRARAEVNAQANQERADSNASAAAEPPPPPARPPSGASAA